jgi:hypothetical protein
MEFCEKVMEKGLLSVTMGREFDDLVQFIPTGNLTCVSVDTLPTFMRENFKMFGRA